jgi:hypothetical protein
MNRPAQRPAAVSSPVVSPRVRRACGASLLLAALVLPASAAPPAIEDMLRDVGVDARDVRLDAAQLELMAGQRPHSPFVERLLAEPLRADMLARITGPVLVHGATNDPVDALSTLARLNGVVVRRGLVGDPLAAHRTAAQEPGALLEVLRTLGAGRIDTDALAAVPPSVQEAAVLVLLTMQDARGWIERAHASVGDQRDWSRIERSLRRPLAPPAGDEPGPDDLIHYKRALDRFATSHMAVAAQDLMRATLGARDLLLADTTLADARFLLRVNTRLGWIILADSTDHVHNPDGAVLLIIDVGGDDSYSQAGANADRERPLSVALDLAGNDTYAAPRPADGLGIGTDGAPLGGHFGAGVLGVGILWDEAGDDTYTAERRTQGCGLFGVGVLVDGGGADVYNAVADAQAHATAGYGLLIDKAGNDRYHAYVASQGFARPNAAAALVDLSGDDEHIANDEDIRFPSPQNPEHNASLCQGAGVGERADYVDGISLAGGVGVLVDAAGNDRYSCGVFGQGVGYWLGAGLLIDFGGNDEYSGHWYVQGASAHFAAGVLVDGGGDDAYFARQNMAQGAGHDVGIGVLVDLAGNDRYTAPTLALGASNAGGIGLFVDHGGDDRYETPARSCLGWVNHNTGFRALIGSYGLFLDHGGTDTYTGRDGQPGRGEAADGTTWLTPPDPAAVVPYVFGFGIDLPDAAAPGAGDGGGAGGDGGAGDGGGAGATGGAGGAINAAGAAARDARDKDQGTSGGGRGVPADDPDDPPDRVTPGDDRPSREARQHVRPGRARLVEGP